MSEIRLVVVDPGHFHAALLQKEMYPNVAPRVRVHAPLGPDLLDYLARIARFNARADSPTRWELEVHAGPDFLDRMRREPPGSAAIFSGRNLGKIQRIEAAIGAGMHVLADKPWIIRAEDMPVLAASLEAAEAAGLIARDLMTGRHDIMARLLRALRNDPEIFGQQVAGSPAEPGVAMTNVHHILKQVAGAPNPRPPWFFDVTQQGEALTDVGTHLVDRVHWTLFPDQALDYRRDIRLHAGRRWPTRVSLAQFRQVTGEAGWPAYLGPSIHDCALDYLCNTALSYEVRGVHVGLDMRWRWQAESGDDTYTAIYRGTRARLEIRHGPAEGHKPQLYVVPAANIDAALERRVAELQPEHPGIGVENRGPEWRLTIPDALRLGHDAHFAALARDFLDHVAQGRPLPAWEKPNMLAKYHVCTQGLAICRTETEPEAAA